MSDSKKFHLGAQNDQIYIIYGEPPALNNDYPNHNADRTLVAKVFDAELAEALVCFANKESHETLNQ